MFLIHKPLFLFVGKYTHTCMRGALVTTTRDWVEDKVGCLLDSVGMKTRRNHLPTEKQNFFLMFPMNNSESNHLDLAWEKQNANLVFSPVHWERLHVRSWSRKSAGFHGGFIELWFYPSRYAALSTKRSMKWMGREKTDCVKIRGDVTRESCLFMLIPEDSGRYESCGL